MRRLVAAALACASLAACGANTQSYATTIAEAQAAYTVAETVINGQIQAGKIPAADAAVIQQIEKVDDPLVAGLSATTAPTSVGAVLADVKTLVTDLPVGTVATDAQTALALAQAGYSLYQSAHPVTN